MESEADDLAQVAAQFADPARARIVVTLMDGSSRSAGELGLSANVSPSSASGHLSKLVDSGILTASKRGRQKYYRITTAAVAHAIEALAVIASPGTALKRLGTFTFNPFAFARTCYDHLAGALGVEITAAMESEGILRPAGSVFEVTEYGFGWLDGLEIDWRKLKSEKRAFALQCLDFTERRPHLAGSLGTALCASSINRGWLVRTRVPRVIRITAEGRKELGKRLPIVFTASGVQSRGYKVSSAGDGHS
ncbi:MAG TPA: helix-turn-helix transcriptional regulator [Bryobacteraceae bacterium]|nr:helix-turn-helix transcriptional regulator [Bryobacteraceae bacterium]